MVQQKVKPFVVDDLSSPKVLPDLLLFEDKKGGKLRGRKVPVGVFVLPHALEPVCETETPTAFLSGEKSGVVDKQVFGLLGLSLGVVVWVWGLCHGVGGSMADGERWNECEALVRLETMTDS